MVVISLIAGLLCAFTAGQQSLLRNYWLMALFVVLSLVNITVAVGQIVNG